MGLDPGALAVAPGVEVPDHAGMLALAFTLLSLDPSLAALDAAAPISAADTDEEAPAEGECPDPTVGSYLVIRKGEATTWVFTFHEDGTWELYDPYGDLYLSGYWWLDDDDPCLIHYVNPDDNGGEGSEADFRWDGDSWNKEGGSHPEVTIELVSFL